MSYDLDFYSKLTKENKLLILCSRSKLNTDIKFKLAELLQYDLDWEYILKFANIHRLIPLLYWNLKEFQSQIPNNIFLVLKENFNENTKKNLLMLGELFKLLNLFKKHGINVIPYKGPILAICAYNNLALRQFDDLDIFVNQNDVLNVKKILISNGFIPQFEFKGYKERKFLNTQREYKFRASNININLEVQWKFIGVSFSLSDDLGLEVVETIEIYNKKIATISSENLLLILCIHASGHYWERLAWICDISELIQSNEMDWGYVFEKSDKLGINRLVMINLLLAKDILDLDLPDNVLKQLKSKRIKNLTFKVIKRIFMKDTDNIFMMAYIRFNIREKRSQGIKDILKIMFYPTNKEWEKSSFKSVFPLISHFYRFFQVMMD